MADSATEELGVRHVLTHRRTTIIAFAVSLLNIPHFVNGVAFKAVLQSMTLDHNQWYQQQTRMQMVYVVVGIIAFAFYAFLFERCRRKTCLYLVCICQSTTSILLLCSRTHVRLLTSRAFSAIGDVGAGMLCVIYISEIAPDKIRGSLIAIHKLLYSSASLIPTVLYLVQGPLKSLPFACISIVINALVAICAFIGVPESPIYFLRREDVIGAKESLKFLYGNETDISQVIINRKKILKATRSDSQTTTSIFQECISRRALKFSSIVMTLFFLRTFATIVPQTSEMKGGMWKSPRASQNSDSYMLPIIDFLVILGILIVLVFCDRVGRKSFLLASSFTCFVCLIAFLVMFYVYNNISIPFEVIDAIYRTIFSVYVFSFNLGVSVLPDVILSDIFSFKILNIQIAILGSFQLCLDYILHYVILNLMTPLLKGMSVLWSLAGIVLCGSLFTIKFVLETKCRPPGFQFMDSEERVLQSELQDNDE